MGMTPAVALTTQSIEPVQAFAAATTDDVISAANLVYTGSSFENVDGVWTAAYSASQYTVAASDFKLSNTTGDVSSDDYKITSVAFGDGVVLENANTYTATATIEYSITVPDPDGGEGATKTETKSVDKTAIFKINPAELSIAPKTNAAITVNTTMADAVNKFEVSGVPAANQAALTDIYNVTCSGGTGANGVAAGGNTITATLSLANNEAASNYVLGTSTASIKVADTTQADGAIEIDGQSYNVAFAPDSVTTFSYNATAQAPKVVFTNTKTILNNPLLPLDGLHCVLLVLHRNMRVDIHRCGVFCVPCNSLKYLHANITTSHL